MKRKRIRFLELFRQFITYHNSPVMIEEIKGPATLKNYRVKYNNVTRFLYENKQIKIYCEEFTAPFANKMMYWLKKQYTHNYAIRTYDVCELVLRWGVSQGLIKANPLYGVRFKKQAANAPIYITPEEVKELELYEGKYRYIADLFLFQCYTGFDYSDLMSLRKTDIFENPNDHRTYIIKKRKKTKCEAFVPYTDKIRLLWEKYQFNFGYVSNKHYNDILKKLSIELRFTVTLTTHVARKTCGMIKLNYEKYSLPFVSKHLGHSSIKTTEAFYARVNLNLMSAELDAREVVKN